MRQWAKFFVILSALLLLGTACQAVEPASETVPEEAGTIWYSNLDSEAARQEVAARLIGAGITQERVNTVLDWAADYNSCMRGCKGFTLVGDFTPASGQAVDYGEYYPMSNQWYKVNGRDYQDILCRIAAFELLGDKITMQNLLPREEWACEDNDSGWLYSDWNILRGRQETGDMPAYVPNPQISWDDAELARYFTLFGPVSIPEGCSSDELAGYIRAEWERRGISFTEGDASLITLWLCSGSHTAAGHAAVLIEDKDGLLLFEKTNPESPYSAAKFGSLLEVEAYLTEMLRLDDARYGIERERPLVLKNGEPIL